MPICMRKSSICGDILSPINITIIMNTQFLDRRPLPTISHRQFFQSKYFTECVHTKGNNTYEGKKSSFNLKIFTVKILGYFLCHCFPVLRRKRVINQKKVIIIYIPSATAYYFYSFYYAIINHLIGYNLHNHILTSCTMIFFILLMSIQLVSNFFQITKVSQMNNDKFSEDKFLMLKFFVKQERKNLYFSYQSSDIFQKV